MKDMSNYKFTSGLTYEEADALVERYVEGFDDKDVLIGCMKVHLKTAVRDNAHFRDVLNALVADQQAA